MVWLGQTLSKRFVTEILCNLLSPFDTAFRSQRLTSWTGKRMWRRSWRRPFANQATCRATGSCLSSNTSSSPCMRVSLLLAGDSLITERAAGAVTICRVDFNWCHYFLFVFFQSLSSRGMRSGGETKPIQFMRKWRRTLLRRYCVYDIVPSKGIGTARLIILFLLYHWRQLSLMFKRCTWDDRSTFQLLLPGILIYIF